MALKRPVAGQPVLVEDFGQPVYDFIIASQVTPWTTLPFQSGWSDFGSGYNGCAYRKVGDIVYLRGMVRSPGGAGTIAYLPAGFRLVPGSQEYGVPYWNGSARVMIAITVTNDGGITAESTTAGSALPLNGIFYSTRNP